VAVAVGAGADVPTALAVVSDAASPAVRGRLIGLTQVFWIAAILLTYALGFAVSRLGFLGTLVSDDNRRCAPGSAGGSRETRLSVSREPTNGRAWSAAECRSRLAERYIDIVFSIAKY
jgi:hypothetical protein